MICLLVNNGCINKPRAAQVSQFAIVNGAPRPSLDKYWTRDGWDTSQPKKDVRNIMNLSKHDSL